MSQPVIIDQFGRVLRDTLVVAGQQKLQEVVTEQPVYKRYSNTITAIVSGLMTFGVWASTNQIGLPDWVQLVVGGIVFVASVLGIKATPNGITQGTVTKVANPRVMEAMAAEAEKLFAAQLEAAFRADPKTTPAPQPYYGEHRAPETGQPEGFRYSP